MPKATRKKDLSPGLRNLAIGGVVTLSCLGSLHLSSSHLVKSAAAVSSTLPIMARLIRAIEVTVNTSLDFGTMAMTMERGGFARIDPALNKLIVEGNSSLSLAGGVPQAGRPDLSEQQQ